MPSITYIYKRALTLLSLLFTLLFVSENCFAGQIVGIVSENSAPQLTAGAHEFLKKHPEHSIVLRTTKQTESLSDPQLHELWSQADALLLIGVFGQETHRLMEELQGAGKAPSTIIAFSGDRRITQLSKIGGKMLFNGLDKDSVDQLNSSPNADTDLQTWTDSLAKTFSAQAKWIQSRAYWQSGGTNNASLLIEYISSTFDESISPTPFEAQDAIRYRVKGHTVTAKSLSFSKEKPLVAIIALNTGDSIGKRAVLDRMQEKLENYGLESAAVLSRWGVSSTQAVQSLKTTFNSGDIDAIISLQDFVIGGGDGRAATTEAFKQLNVPVVKAINMSGQTQEEWMLSEEGLPWNSVHYRVAMPELQGVSQPMVIAAASPARIDEQTGILLALSNPIDSQIERLCRRIQKWSQLKHKANADKKLALIYYNHPPGRHNIGADNLDVPASLWQILNKLKNSGYTTGKLPASPKDLLELIQKQGINLPENRSELERMSNLVTNISSSAYSSWLERKPALIRNEMTNGALGFLQEEMKRATQSKQNERGRKTMLRIVHDLEHLLAEVDHPSRERALALLEELEGLYLKILDGEERWQEVDEYTQSLSSIGIEGLSGWGASPGKVMVHNGNLLLPGIQFGNIFIGPQPPRGWEINEEILHANMAVPPPHQYLAFYMWIHETFKADAMVHLGRHSTYEFLPRRRVGLSGDDYPSIIAGDIPSIYPYIVDGIGEGIQAKRRGLAVMIDHLTPPLDTTKLYDELLKLRQLVESFEANEPTGETPSQIRTIKSIRKKVIELHLEDELVDELKRERNLGQISFEEIDDEMLVHEIGHHLTKMQERFMPLGLHVFGKDWKDNAIDTMLNSIGTVDDPISVRTSLTISPSEENKALLNALSGGYVHPGKGNDPIRTPESLPTGRNFHALDGSLLPTTIAWDIGQELIDKEKEDGIDTSESAAVVLWASDAVRDEGAMIAFGLNLLGVSPVWNSRGIVKDIELIPLDQTRTLRRDVVFTISGLFRDLYGQQVALIDKAVLLAIDASSQEILERHPELRVPLEHALAPLSTSRAHGNDPLEQNQIAANWVKEALEQQHSDLSPAQIGQQAAIRLFGAPAGGYGAGVNRIVERSAAWKDRAEVAKVYLRGMGHAYGINKEGEPQYNVFKKRLSEVGLTYLGRASNLYGLIDNNDAFDYLGGLSMAIESIKGAPPENRIINHSNPESLKIESLQTALLGELRGRFLNPAWIKPLMEHDYAGARTMGSEFLEYLWGWQVTNPEIVKTWVWDEVHDVYLGDKYDIKLDDFLESGQNVHVKINMQAILLVAAEKGFWDASPETLERLSNDFAQLVVKNGLPGSGHTKPDHPIFDWIKEKIDQQTADALDIVLVNALQPQVPPSKASSNSISEIAPTKEVDRDDPPEEQEVPQESSALEVSNKNWAIIILGFCLLVCGGIYGRFRKL